MGVNARKQDTRKVSRSSTLWHPRAHSMPHRNISPLHAPVLTTAHWPGNYLALGEQQLQFRIRIRSRMRTLKSSPVLISSPSSASSGYKYISIGVVQRTHGGGGRHCTVQPACSTLSRMASSPEAKTLASLLHVESWALALSQSSRVACRDLRFTLPEPIFSLAFLARTRVLL